AAMASPVASAPMAPAAAPAGPGSVEDLAAVEAGDSGPARPTEDDVDPTPAFVFFADDSGAGPLAPSAPLASPPSIADATETSPSRSRALLLAVSRTMERPRMGIAVGLVTIVIMATVVGTLVAVISSSS